MPWKIFEPLDLVASCSFRFLGTWLRDKTCMVSDFVFQVLPDAEFHIIPDAGHSNKEPGTEAKLLEACEKYKDL